jgi:hypothetical protein
MKRALAEEETAFYGREIAKISLILIFDNLKKSALTRIGKRPILLALGLIDPTWMGLHRGIYAGGGIPAAREALPASMDASGALRLYIDV